MKAKKMSCSERLNQNAHNMSNIYIKFMKKVAFSVTRNRGTENARLHQERKIGSTCSQQRTKTSLAYQN